MGDLSISGFSSALDDIEFESTPKTSLGSSLTFDDEIDSSSSSLALSNSLNLFSDDELGSSSSTLALNKSLDLFSDNDLELTPKAKSSFSSWSANVEEELDFASLSDDILSPTSTSSLGIGNSSKAGDTPFASLDSITIEAERDLLTGSDGEPLAATVVQTTGGNISGSTKPGALEFSFSGVNEAPNTMQPIAQQYDGYDVMRHAVAYNEQDFDLSASAKAAANGIRNRLKSVDTDTPLVVDAYSMGTRVAIGTLIDLNREGLLDRPTTVNLYASTTPGYESANWIPPGALSLLNRAYASMGSRSDYQEFLNSGAPELAANSNIQFVYVDGGADTTVPGAKPTQASGGADLVRRAVKPNVYVLPTADHGTVRQQAIDAQLPLLPTYLSKLPSPDKSL